MLATPAPTDATIPTTTASSRGWRMTVVGLVALLSIGIGAALGSYLLNGRSAGLGSAASYVPADATIYVEVRLTPSADQDAALREVLGRFPPIDGLDLTRPLSETLPERLDELLGSDGDAVISWAADVAPWFDGRIGLAGTPPSSAGGDAPGFAPGTGSGVMLLGVTDPAAAADALDRIVAAMDPSASFSESEHEGTSIRESTTGVGAYALTEDQLLVAFTADDIRTSLSAHASGDTLERSGDISGYASRLPAEWLVFVTYDLSDLIADSMAPMGGDGAALTDAFSALAAHQPDRLAFSVSATADGVAFDAYSDLPTGPFAPANADRGLASEVPDDAFYFADAGNVGPALAALTEAIEEAVSSSPEVADQIATMESALGAELSELVAWIGDGAVAIGSDETGLYGGMVLVPSDMAEAERRLGQLATFARLAAADPSTGLAVSEASVETASGPVTVVTVTWLPGESAASPLPSEAMPFTALVVEYAVTDDRSLVGLGSSFVRRALHLDPARSLAADPRYAGAVATLGGTPNAGTMWVDLTGLREAVESFIPIEAEMTYQTDVLPWLLPLDRLVSVSRVEGSSLETHMVLFVE